MKDTIIIILFPFFLFSQEVFIKPLSDNVNTNQSEINFIQKNDSIAYFTAVVEVDGRLESNIYSAIFIDNNWIVKRYSKYNLDVFNTANISFLGDHSVFFTICNQEMLDCKIVYMDDSSKKLINEIKTLYSDRFFNTQPFAVRNKDYSALYFVSDRKGGFGGLDIWVLIIDNDGKFGVPINAGSKINSSSDEITPFYNEQERMLYFSSNRDDGLGDFDIYKSEGSLNLWREPNNVKELNSDKDDLYLTFYDTNNGYFSSNRKGSKSRKAEYCCNDIYSFKYMGGSLDTVKRFTETHNYLPLSLYFHNDEPDSQTMAATTKKTYKESYISYFMMKDYYEKQNPNSGIFFEDILQKNFNRLNHVLDMLILDLSNGHNIEMQIRGYASPLHNIEYNQNLSQRRISSFINYLIQFKSGLFAEYISSEKLTITELPFGESNASNKVSDDANDKKRSIYSIEAMLERKIEIVDVILKE